jgi:hypothetical protein
LKNENKMSSGFEEVRHQEPTPSERPGETGAGASLQQQVAKEFSRALRRARKAAATGNPELAVEWCRYAASLAWGENPGFFYCHEMEQLLMEIGRKYFKPTSAAPPSVRRPQRFLHVMSTAYETGGHTRVVSCWIETCAQHAPSEHHSILISLQKGDPLPAWLGHSAQKTGGKIIVLPSGLTWLQTAAEVRSRSLEFDAIILHIHPNDPLPNLALYDQPRPILFFRHADHVFNLGLDVARVVADIRPQGHAMSIHFCGKQSRKVMLPLPLLDGGMASCDKAEARKRLGLPLDNPTLLTIGSRLKFTPMEGYSFPTVIQSLCEANPQLHIVAVGLSELEPFPGLAQSMGGWFHPVGVVKDREILELYYRAADIYLDAYPNSSLTAVLDAARHGLPVQRLFNRDRCLMWGSDLGLDSVMLGASTQEEFIRKVLEWLEWPEERRSELGSRFRNAILDDHCGASWKYKWLGPAINALISPREDPLDLRPDCLQDEERGFPGLGKAGAESDWPAGMFVAGTILNTDHVPRPIRIHGVLHSIKPLLFNAGGDGMTRRRLSMFKMLVSSCMPDQVRTAMRRIWSSISEDLLNCRKSAN